MADIIDATTTSITEKVNGVDRVFRFLNTYDKAQIIRKMRSDAKAKLLENLKTAGASSEQIAVDLGAFDADPPSDWVEFVTSYEGINYAFQLSLEKTYPGEGEKIVREGFIPDTSLNVILFAICGLKEKEKIPEQSKGPDTRTYGYGGDESNPTISPLTYTGTATTPLES